jgi:C4-dicarboxylate-specific signal transduction histidine kinase
LDASPPDVTKARRTAERIIEDGTRAGTVLARIRALFRKEPATRALVDLKDVICDLTVFLQDDARRRQVAIRTDLAGDLPAVVGDRVQLQQVVLNLVLNAMDAMARSTGGKEVLISAHRDEAGDILLCVRDRGVGVEGDLAERIFDPFFTTKPQGLGLGLSISRSIVESHGGRMWATPCAEGGASLRFTLPTPRND